MGEDRYQRIYRCGAEMYEALVACEDCDGNLGPALAADRHGDVVEFGAGTGRLTRLLAPKARSIRAFDASPAMLAVARRALGPEVHLAAALNPALPVRSGSADLALAGWSFGHATGWNPDGWRGEIDRCLAEVRRVLRPGGRAVVIETLGTGRTEPAPPSSILAEYYDLLESAGFARTWIRTDYRFARRTEADRLCRAFFGRSFPLDPDGSGWRLPECSGIWRLRV